MASQENGVEKGDTQLSNSYSLLPIIPTVTGYDELEARKR